MGPCTATLRARQGPRSDPASICSGVRAPTMAPVTPGHASVHATATADTVTPRRSAIGRSASRSAKFRERFGSVNCTEPRRQSSAIAATRLAENVSVSRPRLHRAVHDDARSVRVSPRDHIGRCVASNQRKRRLEAVHVAYRFGALEERDVEVRHAHCTNFSLATCMPHASEIRGR